MSVQSRYIPLPNFKMPLSLNVAEISRNPLIIALSGRAYCWPLQRLGWDLVFLPWCKSLMKMNSRFVQECTDSRSGTLNHLSVSHSLIRLGVGGGLSPLLLLLTSSSLGIGPGANSAPTRCDEVIWRKDCHICKENCTDLFAELVPRVLMRLFFMFYRQYRLILSKTVLLQSTWQWSRLELTWTC